MPSEIDRLIGAIEAFRQFDPEMQAQAMIAFLTVAQKPGIGMKDLAKATGIALSSTSRNVYSLSRWKTSDEPGHDLIALESNRHNRREKIVTLTPKGERFMANLKRVLSPTT